MTTMDQKVEEYMHGVGRRAREAARAMSRAETGAKNAALLATAKAIEARVDALREANARDLAAGRDSGLDAALLDRLELTPQRIADMADAFYVPVAPHNVSSPLGMMAACHCMAAAANFHVLEFHGREIPWWSDLCDGDKPFIQDGWMAVSDRPGIGVELNDKVAKTLLWNGDTYFD